MTAAHQTPAHQTSAHRTSVGTDPTVQDVRALIVGSGFAGIAMAVRLREQGIDDFVVIERGADVGGTWRDNTYPGAACDVPSHLYSFSFALNPEWTRSFSPQPEIQRYLRRVARRHEVYPHCRFETEFLGATWDPATQHWQIRTSRGDYRAQFLISGSGALCEPSDPDIPGLDTFTGTTFHSARWNHEHDLTGERVTVIGTGASAIQFVPRIAERVGSLTVHQRTAPWVIPRHDRALGRAEKWIYRNVPGAQRLARTAIYWGRESYVLGFAKNPKLNAPAEKLGSTHLRRQVTDPGLRDRLRPHFTIGCKRILISNDWYPALQRDNVEVVTDAIAEVRAQSVVTADGTERPCDTIIFATGFQVTDIPIAHQISDADGITLAEHWKDGVSAHRGTTVAGFPNLFLLVGPNTGLGHTSMVFMIESQAHYVGEVIAAMDRDRTTALAPRPDAQREFNDDLQRRMAGSVWTAGGCRSWYLDEHGRNTTLWPDFTFRFRRALRRFRPDEYEVVQPSSDREMVNS